MALENLEKAFESQIKRLKSLSNAQLKHLEKYRARKMQRIEREYTQRKMAIEGKQSDSERAMKDAYSRLSAEMIYYTLKKDLAFLEIRSKGIILSPDEIERFEKINRLLAQTENEQEKEKLRLFLEIAGIKTELLNPIKEEKTIKSYITSDGEKKFYLLLPINMQSIGDADTRVPQLVRNLESRIRGIIEQDRIMDSNKKFLSYSPDYGLCNGFLLYHLVSNEPSPNLEKPFEAKLRELQPEGFKKAGLKHLAKCISYEVLEYFKNHDLSNIPEKSPEAILEEFNAEYPADNQKLSREKHEQQTKEAWQRLKDIDTPLLNAGDIQRVMGLKRVTSVYHLADNLEGRIIREGKIYLPRESFENYLSARKLSARGWRAD